MKLTYRENLIKNLILLLLLILAYPIIQNSFLSSNLALDKTLAGNLLVAVSILSVIACFGAFSFTYEKVNQKDHIDRFLAHLAVGLLMLLVGLSIEMTAILVKLTIGNLPVFDLSLVSLYLAVVLYDFWDLKRAEL